MSDSGADNGPDKGPDKGPDGVPPDQTPAEPAAEPAAETDLAQELLARARARAQGRRGAPGRRSSASRGRAERAGTLSGPGPDDRDPQPVGATVDRLVSERGWQVPVAVGGIEGRWDQIVGEEVAAHARPETFEAGVLTVRADSTAWATQLRMLAPGLLRRLAEELGAGTVHRITVLGPAGPSWSKGRLRVKGRGPRDTYG